MSWARGVLVGVLAGLLASPAAAFYTGYRYEDGSDAIFGGLPNVRTKFETTLADELDHHGAKWSEAEMADLKGLVHPIHPNGEPNKHAICGWVKGFGEITGREFRPFLYMEGAPLARIAGKNGESLASIKETCGKALGL